MDNKLNLIKIKNPFIRTDRDIEVIEYQNQNLLDLRNIHFPQDIAVCISVNGKLISADKLSSTYPLANDQILFIPEIMDGDDGKAILGSILMIVIAIAAPYAAAAILGKTVATMGLAGAFLATGIVMVGGLIYNALLPPAKSTLGDTSDLNMAQTYGWDPQTVQQQGITVPKFYGANKLYGNIIASYVEIIDDTQYVNALICLGLGPYNYLKDFKINDQDINDFQGVSIEARYGDLNQDVISNFNNTKTEYPLAKKIVKDTPYTYTTDGDEFNGLEVDITFPQGLFYTNDEGELDAYSVDIRVEIRRQGEDWRSISEQAISVEQVITVNRWSAGYWVKVFERFEYDMVWKEIVAGDSDPYAHKEGDIYNKEWNPDIKWRWITVEETTMADETVDYVTVSGSQTSSITKTFKADDLTTGTYDIRVSNLTADQTSPRYGDDAYFTMLREVYYDDFLYPRHVLIGIKALATDQLSGSLRFSCMAECSKIKVYNGTSWSVQFSDNPAWVAWDVLTQPVFGFEQTIREDLKIDLNVLRYDGIDPSRLDLVKFKEWADFCDTLAPDGTGGEEKRITFNGGFEVEQTMWEAVMQICQIGRAILVWNGVNLTVAIDQSSSPVQLFSVGNIGIDKFKETFLPMEDRTAEIEIDFIDSEKDYERNLLTVINPDIDSKVNKVNLQLFGITKSSEAWRAGMYRLYNNQYILRIIEFEADIDSIACTVGDVINIQHDIPQWGYGGRVVSAIVTAVTIDREVTIQAGKSYTILIKLSNDSVVERNITNSPGTYTTLTISSPFSPGSIPQQYDVYSFGETAKVVKPFRIISLKRSQEQKATITAVEYNESIYNVDTDEPVLPTPDYSSLEPLPPVSNIILDELLIKGKDGVIIDTINVYFTPPDNSTYKYGEIWYNEGVGWKYAGDALTNYYEIKNVKNNKVYWVAVATVNQMGQKQLVKKAPKASIYTLGKLDPPSDVTGFTATQNGQFVNFNWTHIPDADLWSYEIKIGTLWESAREIVTGVSQNQFSWQAELDGTYRFLIKALDESGIYSLNATSVDITLKGIDDTLNVIFSQDEMTKDNPADGTKTNFVYILSYHALMIPHTLTDTDVPDWDDLTPVITGYEGDINLDAEYITNAIDVLEDTDTWIRIVETIDAIEVGVTDQSYPDRIDLTYPQDTDTHITASITYKIYYAVSDDNLIYSDWIEYKGTVQNNFRYAKFKLVLNVVSQTIRFKLSNFLLSLDVADVELLISALSIAATTGTNVLYSAYGKVFHFIPTVWATLINDTVSKVPVISNKTTTGFHIDLLDVNNNKVAGLVDVEASGY